MRTIMLDSLEGLRLNGVSAAPHTHQGRKGLQVSMLPFTPEEIILDGPYFAWLPVDFHNGVLEVELAGAPSATADQEARGFVGLAFRIAPFGPAQPDGRLNTDTRFEAVYLRPTNGRADDQVRRNHATQYFAYPGYDVFRFRREEPGKYESYVDLQPGVWTDMRLEVRGAAVRLFVHGAEQPCLVVNDMKNGPDLRGGVGLWVERGTVAHFRNLRITDW